MPAEGGAGPSDRPQPPTSQRAYNIAAIVAPDESEVDPRVDFHLANAVVRHGTRRYSRAPSRSSTAVIGLFSSLTSDISHRHS